MNSNQSISHVKNSNPHSGSSNLGYFSPQTTFYATSTDKSISGMDFVTNNPLLRNIVEQGMKDITVKTVNMLPNELQRSLLSIKYYFAVNQTYVVEKLSLIVFPFRSRNWSTTYNTNGPIPPRIDINAPDFYIPLMSALTYVLIAGFVLGTQNRFTPEQLGAHASWIFIWNIIENSSLCLIFYLFNIQSQLRILDLIAYCGYKYVGMIVVLFVYLITHSIWIYRCALLYSSISIAYFLMKCLRQKVLSGIDGYHSSNTNGHQRRISFLLLIIFLQPIFIWYLTQHLIVI